VKFSLSIINLTETKQASIYNYSKDELNFIKLELRFQCQKVRKHEGVEKNKEKKKKKKGASSPT
jgi:hypothetical protein